MIDVKNNEKPHTLKFGFPDRSILKFYERVMKYVPIGLMLVHWYGTWDFHHQPRLVLLDNKDNEACVAFIYFMIYVFPLLSMLPASKFFHLCWIYRIPFYYLFGVNVIRMLYGKWLITSEMIAENYFLIVLTIILYIYAFIKLSFARYCTSQSC